MIQDVPVVFVSVRFLLNCLNSRGGLTECSFGSSAISVPTRRGMYLSVNFNSANKIPPRTSGI
jgi:hypothetical protein